MIHPLAPLIRSVLPIASLLFFAWISVASSVAAADTTDSAAGNQLIDELATKLKTRKTVGEAIDEIVASDSEQKSLWLDALLNGDLYRRKSDDKMVFAEKAGRGFKIVAASDNTDLGEVGRRDVSKIKINNALRSKLRSAIALASLQNPDPEARIASIEQMLPSLDEGKLTALKLLSETEQNPDVLALLNLADELDTLDSGDTANKLQAIESIGLNTRPVVVQRLKVLAADDSDAEVSAAAGESLEAIEKRIAIFEKVETLLFGLSLGSVLAMAAIGLAITFGVMGVINMAHGELIMLGAYTTWFIQQLAPGLVEYSLIAAVPIAFCFTFLVGVLIEFLVIRHLYGRPLETLLATFGISLILQQAVRTIVSPQNVPVSNPSWLTGQWHFDPALSVAINRVVIFFFCIAVFVILMWILRKTFFGLKIRAVSQNRQMARAMGAQSSRIDALTFGLGAGIAGVAGVALSQLTNVGPNMGQSYIVDSFMVVVFGGVGNLWGTLLAGLSLGVVNKFLEPWVGAVVAKIVVLVFIIIFIQRRPRGLFPQRGRAAGD